jgi:hypothetical protein
MGLFSGILSNKKGIRDAKEVAGAQQYTAIAAMEAADRERARGISGEQAKAAVWGLLGQPGTYGADAANNFTQGTNMENLFNTSGLGLSQPNQALGKMAPNYGDKKLLLGQPREGILDPEAYANFISGSSSFRIQSQRVAESEQLLNQEGPAWDMLSNSVLGVINEGSALQLRDSMRKLRNQYAKGGSARRTAMFEANELLTSERAMRTKVQETWQANLALYDSVRQNADRVADGTQRFMAGLPLVNDSYRDAMQRTATMQMQASEIANNSVMSAYDTKMTQQPVNFMNSMIQGGIKFTASLVGKAANAAATYYTGGAAGGSYGAAFAAEGSSGGGGDAGSNFDFGGYTPRNYNPGMSTGGGMDTVGNTLQAAFDYMNSPREAGYGTQADADWGFNAGGDDTGNPVSDRYGSG